MMKNTKLRTWICASILTLITSTLSGQVEIGKFQFSGAGGLQRYEESGSPTGSFEATLFQLNLRAGYFPIENLAAGFLLSGYTTNGSAANNNRSLSLFASNSWVVGPYARYYIFGKVIGGLSYTYNTNYELWGPLTLELGYAAFLGEKVALEPVFYLAKDTQGEFKSTDMGMLIGFSVFL